MSEHSAILSERKSLPAPLDAAATGARRAFYGASQAARILWYTGHYVAGRRLMGPLTEPGDAPMRSNLRHLTAPG